MNQKILSSKDTQLKVLPRLGCGVHLTIDGYGCDRKSLADLGLVFRVLNDLPGSIGMEKITTPYVIPYESQKNNDWGISGFVMIAESHIAIHTYPDEGFVAIDVFSCRNFDVSIPVNYLAKAFDIKRIEKNVVKRASQRL